MKSGHLLPLVLCYLHTHVLYAQAPLYEKTVTVAGKLVYMASMQDPAQTSGEKVPVLLALHGSGREALSYRAGDPASVPFYVHQRDLALQSGYLFVSISNGQDTWGREKGINAVLDLYSYVTQTFQTDRKWVLWASSAGGVLANRMVKEHPDKVRKVIGTFPVYDLSESYEHLASARKAWESAEAVQLVNPAGDPGSLIAVPYLIFHGTGDVAVPASLHSEKLQKEVKSAGGDVTLHLVPGGHSTANFALYNDGIIKEFLSK